MKFILNCGEKFLCDWRILIIIGGKRINISYLLIKPAFTTRPDFPYSLKEFLEIILDNDLAELYFVETKQLKRAVRRNLERFPEDFMFQIKKEENDFLRSQFGTLKRGEHSKYLPYAFTEQGVAMLSSVLASKRAIQVNIQIMRIFTKMREMIAQNDGFKKKIEALELKYQDHDERIREIFFTLKKLMDPPGKKPKKEIGFHTSL
ncbi:MAG: hypothetical protein ACD_79C00511G0004 [uncultured bacterium]|nr:MAG: hypothetical protein ACD_79C00511G0004 [uncultured bacterium]